MQTLDVISLNVWQIIISLCNLLILFFVLKKFLYKPVKRVFEERQRSLESKYTEAAEKIKEADSYRAEWDEKIKRAEEIAEHIKEDAAAKAEQKSREIIANAKEKADIIISEAEIQSNIERVKAQNDIRNEIIDISAVIAEKIIEREISADDHRAIIDSVISEIGDKIDEK